MTLTWKSTLLLTVLGGLIVWYVEREVTRAAAVVVRPVVAAAQGAANADPLSHGSVWTTLQNALEMPIGGSTAAVDRWVQGVGQ